ncbi:MAG TPA: fused MFS/spermidine synthase [Myxococcota bacterium]|nr:fused MFS/spermidine synthase [Myxococcota bacterium]
MTAYRVTIFLSAFLLFLVQPIIGKNILPWFGGSPSVWTTCLLFFQALLLAGYGYAHRLSGASARWQRIIHLGLLAASLCLLACQACFFGAPLLAGSGFRPADCGYPMARVLVLLGLGVGLPFLVLSATSPLLQNWYTADHRDVSPYRLYSLSNLGSLAALLSFPFLVEPKLHLAKQAWLWAGLFVLFVILSAAIALRSAGHRVASQDEPRPKSRRAGGKTPQAPDWSTYLAWLALSGCTSALLLAISNQICQEVAVIPLLWIAPLSVYLLSFIITFGSARWYSRRVFGPSMIISLALAAITLFQGVSLEIRTQIMVFVVCEFACCLVLHGELARLKPHPRHLTAFYLTLAAGGVMGALGVTLVAPVIFDGFYELHLALFTACGLFFLMLFLDKNSWLWGPRRMAKRTFAIAIMVALGSALTVQGEDSQRGSLFASRNFFGVLRVKASQPGSPDDYVALVDGRTVHGLQFTDKRMRNEPTTYYGRRSGGGLALSRHPKRLMTDGQCALRVGVVGLGIGTLAVFGERGDTFRFYELNPKVAELARGAGGYFSFLKDSKANIEVELGDGRLLLERESKNGRLHDFDVLVIDAFSSDSIPVHLLTVEAIELYLARLKPDGILALHISNKSLYLEPLAEHLATHFDMPLLVVHGQKQGNRLSDSLWALMTKNDEFMQAVSQWGVLIQPDPNRIHFAAGLWTDDFSNLFEIMK